MPRFAANLTTMFTERAFPDRFAAAAAAGFEAVEFLFPYDHTPEAVAGWLGEAGLACAMFNLPPGDWDAGERGIAGLPGREDEFRRSVETALHYARALGVRRLHCMAGLRAAGAERATYLANLRQAAATSAIDGIDLLIEPINGRDMPGCLLDSWDEARAIQDAVGAPNLRLQADLYHLQIIGADLSHLLERDIARIGHVQIAGVPDRDEPDGGEVVYPHLFALLDRLGYAGWIGCEYRPRGRTEDGLKWLPRHR